MSAVRRWARRAGPAGALLLIVVGCGGAEQREQAPSENLVEYTVRGIVVDVPQPGRPASELQVRHEAIPSFRTEEGVIGMDAMTMPFPVAEGVSLEAIDVGDIVRLTFRVRYEPETWKVLGYETVEITELSEDTELIFERLGEDEPADGRANGGAGDDGN